MYEVEVKVEADRDRVRERVPTRARPLGAVVQVDTYYDAPHREFAETDEALRIRRERPVDGESWSAAVTYKGPLLEAESKSREEFETGVDDGDTLGAAFERLGFTPAATVRKERERYAVGEYTVTLDAVEDVGEFVEVETEVEDADIEAARDGALDLLADIGCDPEARTRTSYLGLLLADGD